jgi:hypothetical protein
VQEDLDAVGGGGDLTGVLVPSEDVVVGLGDVVLREKGEQAAEAIYVLGNLGGPGAVWEYAKIADEVMGRESLLLEIVVAAYLVGGIEDLLDGWDQSADENSNDDDDHKQSNHRKTTAFN